MATDKRIIIGAIAVVAILLVASIVVMSSQGPGDTGALDKNEAPLPAASLIVANGTVTKASGEVEHTAEDFTAALQWAVAQPGAAVLVPAGSYEVDDTIGPLSGVTLMGEGDGEGGTILNFINEDPSHAQLRVTSGVNNVTLASFRVTGNANIVLLAYGTTCGGHVLRDVTAYRTTDEQPASFSMQVLAKGVLEDVRFIRCKALSTDNIGFFAEGDGYNAPGGVTNTPTYSGWIKGLYMEDCLADHCGYYDRYNSWAVGFDLAESVNVEDVHLVRCTATYSWESGFHFEPSPRVVNAVLEDCVASYNGQKPDDHPNGDGTTGRWFGKGYYWEPYRTSVTLIDCTGEGNANGLRP